MLDDRLLGKTFTLTSSDTSGTISLLGILYQYRLLGPAEAGDTVVIVKHTPLYLGVIKADSQLTY
ncbi:hypothetical protein [Lacticaseibacillus saniviri]|uniref:Uncharacterized protein n=1 Tax=Lacticaseibacillus saniviri JCM 17471 = DSM 24301 TaxID=1293598 RepID=A0A0R2MT77_9LACO|nr:hypothetical protein [Lacticaseibacillus saniviri]KRO16060.1 hypothetical protein IV56_GL002059 [Lacticaseibacillus saniviri JCM 17471 = DSM 24301]MCG4281345.1 hypothetical protein [Lacticaseibacillus saniviri]